MNEYVLENGAVKNFIKAGKALFTVRNEETGGRFTFKVQKHPEKDLWFVKALTGNNNESDYRYIGMIAEFGTFRRTAKSSVTEDAPCFRAFDWLWRHIGDLPVKVKVYHEGRCGRCGRTLTVPESIMTGYGPECASRM